MQLLPGTPIAGGKYTLIEQLGEGGQSEVWRAQQVGLEGFSKDVVLKFILPEQETNQALRTMLLQEARLVAQLTHPNIVQIFDVGEEDERLYLAMERIKGYDLSVLLEAYQEEHQSPLPWPIVASLMAQICAGLHHAHTQTNEAGEPLGIVHRDLKPENVLLNEDGFVKLIDFGIAKSSAGRKTKTGSIKGTPAYMSPEQIRGAVVDHRSDLFSLGSILYELCSGHLAFEAGDVFTLLMLVSQQEPIPLQERQPTLPEALCALAAELLAKDPSQRPPHARHMRRVLEATLHQAGHLIGQEELAEVAQALSLGLSLPTSETLRSAQAPSPASALGPALAAQPLPPLSFPSTTPQHASPWVGTTPEHKQESPTAKEHSSAKIAEATQTAGAQVAPQETQLLRKATRQELRPRLAPQPLTQLSAEDPAVLETQPKSRWGRVVFGVLLLVGGVGLGWWIRPTGPAPQPVRSTPLTNHKPPPLPHNPPRTLPGLSAPPALPTAPIARPSLVPNALPQPHLVPGLNPLRPPMPGHRFPTPGPMQAPPHLRRPRVKAKALVTPPRRRHLRRRRKRMGTLRIEIEPRCKIYEGSRWLGHSNGLVLRRPAGRFRFRCVCRSCFMYKKFRTRLRAGRRKIFRRQYRKATLFINASPWGSVYLRHFGQIGFTQQHLALYEGRHVFTLFKLGKTGFRKTISVYVKGGKKNLTKVYRW